jgi:hypothetical protein
VRLTATETDCPVDIPFAHGLHKPCDR